MPTCFLKRVLPFALTLAVGLTLGTLFNKTRHVAGGIEARTGGIGFRQATGYGNGIGTGRGSGMEYDYGRPFPPREVDQKARILSRAQPQYTETARENQVAGTVVLRAVFSARGEVTNIRVVSGLPFGLTESAIEAAREIQFSPAIKDGRAVSQYIQIEYNFALY